MEEYIGIVKIFAGNFAPRGWQFCHGQLLPISQFSALFSIIGTSYGGDGRTTFALPNLRGRVPIGSGHEAGLTNYKLGDQGGKEKIGLSKNEMPAHSHQANLQVASPVTRGSEKDTEAANHYLADGNAYSETKNNSMPIDAIEVEETGNGTAHENRQPFLALNYIICIQGSYPPRS